MPGLESALELARAGFPVFPVHGIKEGRCACGNPHCGSPGKHPIRKDWQKSATYDEAKVAEIFNGLPYANVGIATGDGLVVVDLDGAEGLATLASWETEHGPLPLTPQVRTGGGGLHLYFQCKETIHNSVRRLGEGVDIRGEGGFVVGPGSAHISGQSYDWVEGRSPDELRSQL